MLLMISGTIQPGTSKNPGRQRQVGKAMGNPEISVAVESRRLHPICFVTECSSA